MPNQNLEELLNQYNQLNPKTPSNVQGLGIPPLQMNTLDKLKQQGPSDRDPAQEISPENSPELSPPQDDKLMKEKLQLPEGNQDESDISKLINQIKLNNEEASKRRSMSEMGAGLGKAGNLIGAGIMGVSSKLPQVQIHNEIFDDQIKSAEKHTRDADKKNEVLGKLISKKEELTTKKENAKLLAQGKLDAKSDKDEEKKDKFTQSLRKEISTGALKTVYSNVMNSKRAERLIQDAIDNPNGFKDFGVLMGTLRALQGDDSVIKDAERKAGEDVGSILDKISVRVKKLKNGESLTDDQRHMLLQAAKPLIDAANDQAKVAFEPLFTQADEMGIPREKLISADFLGDKKAKEVKEALSPGKASKPKTVMQNGHSYTLNEQTGEYE